MPTRHVNDPVAVLARLRHVAAECDVAIVAVAGPDALADETSRALLAHVLPPSVAADSETVLLITPRSAAVHCGAGVWAGALQPALDGAGGDGQSPLEFHVYVPDAMFTNEQLLDFKLNATREMLDRAAREATILLAGSVPLAGATNRWPLLRAATLHGGPPALDASAATPAAKPPQLARAAQKLAAAMRSADAAALASDGWAGRGVAAICAGWTALSSKLCNLDAAYDRAELSEKFLSDTALKAMAARAEKGASTAVATPSATVLAESGTVGVWVGVRTSKCASDPSKKKQMRISGISSTPPLHAVVRLADPAGSGVSAARTFFLSNGRAPHHWQHRVFSDGEVFDPIVEDDLPEVDRGEETLRMMTLYGVLSDAVGAAAAAAAAAAPARPSTESLRALLLERLAAARDESKLLPSGFDLATKATLTVRRVLKPVGVGGGLAPAAADAMDSEDDPAPAHWYVHVVCARLDDVPSVRWSPDSEGSLVFEESYALDGSGGCVALTDGVPVLACWPAEGAEESEARQVRGAVESNALCKQLHIMVERLRAGEHHVLQVLAVAPVTDAIVLTTSPWMPILRGELRLFTGGICIDTPQHGPHTLPFRIHLAAAASCQLHHNTKTGLVLLRQKPDAHGYGPLAVLPNAPGETEAVPMDDPPLRTLSFAIVVPPRSALADGLETVWPIWQKLFVEHAVPLDELPAPPAEFLSALEMLGRAETAAV